VARRWFFETVVRLHRAGEGAPYTGLKPAGLDVGPVILLAEKAAESGDSEAVYQLLAADKDTSIAAGRAHVQAMLGFQIYTHQIYRKVHGDPRDEHQHGRPNAGCAVTARFSRGRRPTSEAPMRRSVAALGERSATAAASRPCRPWCCWAAT
jgi:hypothetical protein